MLSSVNQKRLAGHEVIPNGKLKHWKYFNHRRWHYNSFVYCAFVCLFDSLLSLDFLNATTKISWIGCIAIGNENEERIVMSNNSSQKIIKNIKNNHENAGDDSARNHMSLCWQMF